MPRDAGPYRRHAPIFDDPAVGQANQPRAAFGNCRVVGDQQQGRAKAGVVLEQAIDYDAANGAVEISGGLIGQQQLGPGYKGPGDRNPLLLTTRELAGLMRDAVREADCPERFLGRGKGIGPTAQLEGDRDVLQRRHCRDQMKGLEYDADPRAAEPGKRVFIERAEVDPVNQHSSGTQTFQPAKHHQQGGFPGARRADDADAFPRRDLE